MTWFDDHYADPDDRRAVIKRLNSTDRIHLDRAYGDHGFGAFLAEANRRVRDRLGTSIYGMPIDMWREAYDDDLTPEAALAAAAEDLERHESPTCSSRSCGPSPIPTPR